MTLFPQFLVVLVVAACLGGEVLGTVTLTAEPAVLTSSPANVTLTWDGIDDAENYTIGVYLNQAGLNHVGGFYIFPGATKGSRVVTLVNPRLTMEFKLCKGSDCSPSVYEAISNTVSFNLNEPLFGRLARTNDPTALMLMFTTLTALHPPQVILGTSPDALSAIYNGTSAEPYTISDMCFAPANTSVLFFPPGYQNSVNLTGLTPSQTYYYSFGGSNGEESNFSGVKSFTVPPASGLSSQANLIVFGDMGVSIPMDFVVGGSSYFPAANSITWMASMLNHSPPFPSGNTFPAPSGIIHIGDISYARGYPIVWEYFMAAIEPLASQVPWTVGIGNHEFDYKGFGEQWVPDWSPYGTDSGGECGVAYSARFSMPLPPPQFTPSPTGRANNKNLWFSYNEGPIHFIMMSTEHDFTEGSTQHNFFIDDLSSVDRSVTPWVVFMGHRPMYSSTLDPTATYQIMLQVSLEPLFREYHVDVALWGHVHQYERSCGVTYNGTCADDDEDGTVHVVIGNAGNTYQTPWLTSSPFHNIIPDWLIFRTVNWGISSLMANATTLYFESRGYMRNEVHDSFVLTKA